MAQRSERLFLVACKLGETGHDLVVCETEADALERQPQIALLVLAVGHWHIRKNTDNETREMSN